MKKHFDLNSIGKLKSKTPFFIFNEDVLKSNYKNYKKHLPTNTEIYYAMKSNSEPEVLKSLNALGSGFEVASKYELALLKRIGVRPEKIIYGTSMKPQDHIKEFFRYGVNRFAFDSENELRKISRLAPKSFVYVRALVDDRANSVFTMSEKFGTNSKEAVRLMRLAKELGLTPYGISFNVGSQARNVKAWSRGIKEIGIMMKKLQKSDIKIEMIDIGGGFPFKYQSSEKFPIIQDIGREVRRSTARLPYKVKIIAEPGRGLVADAYALIASVIGKNKRSNGTWLHIDCGIYNALLEASMNQGSTRYKVSALDYLNEKEREEYILTGPTGDNLDVIHEKALLPKKLKEGDRLVIMDTGAYSFVLMTRFNGFPKPKILKD